MVNDNLNNNNANLNHLNSEPIQHIQNFNEFNDFLIGNNDGEEEDYNSDRFENNINDIYNNISAMINNEK